MNKLITKYFHFILLSSSSLLYSQNYSLSFDGNDDYVSTTIPYTDLLGVEAISIEATIKWISEDSDGGPPTNGILSNGSSIDGHQIDLNLNNSGNQKISIYWSDSSTPGSPNMQSATLDYIAVPFNEWFNFKVILNNNSAEWFVNNSLVEVDEVLFTSIGYYQENGVPNLDLGRGNRVYDTFFHGLIDEIILSKDGSNLIAHWNFNSGEGDVLDDFSGNGNDGIINGATWSGDVPVLPVYGCTDSYALNFNSDANEDDGSCYGYPDDNNYSLDFGGDVDYVELGATDNFDFSDEQQLTISAYVKAQGNNEVIFQAEESFGYYIGTHNEGEFALTMYFDGYEDLCVSSTDITDENWHHVVGAYDGNSIKIYVDGELENTCDAGVLVSQDQSSPITIGAYRAGESNYQWNGSIDELNIWNVSLSDDDVVGLLSADTIISSENLIANYKFNSGSGDILFDHSGNANHGQINEATWADGFRMPSSQVTFLVNMREFAENDVLSEGVYISGGNIGFLLESIDDQTGFQMFDDDGDHVYEVTLNLDRNSFYNYKFRIGLTDGNWQGNWEGIPQDCGYGEWFDRSLNTSSAGSQIVGPYCFSSCDNCEVPNRSLSFDGEDDYAFIQESGPIGSSARSFQFKVKVNSYEQSQGLFYYGNGDYGNWGQLFSINIDDSGLYIDHNSGWCKFEGIVIDNSFHDYTLVMEAGNTLNDLVLYQDGVAYNVSASDHGQPGTFEINTASSPIYIGKSRHISDDYPSQYFNGLIDELTIWDISLTEEQVQSFLYSGHSEYEEGIVSYWDFNEGVGSSLTDYSGNGNHGIINGASWDNDFMIPFYQGPEWFVNEDGSDGNNGSQDYPFASIQHAINSSDDGDSILVSSGTYYENINFYGKEVKVFGLSGPEETIIDGQAMNSAVVAFRDFDYSDAGIYGFTIQNAEYGVMVLNGGSPEIKWCIVRDITLGGDGGFYLAGDGIGSSPTVSECLIYGNESTSGEGGGIRVASNNGNSSALIINCTIVGNSPEGIRVHGPNTVVDVVNTIIYDNPTSITNLGTINITNSNVQGGFSGEGNFNDDPQFCNSSIDNYELSTGSSSLFMGQDSSYVGFSQDPGCNTPYSNYALDFSGNGDYVQIGTKGTENNGTDSDIGSLIGSEPFSVSFWYYTDQNPTGGNDYEFLIDQRRGLNYGDGWLIMNTGGNIVFDIQVGENSEERVSTSNIIETGNWNYIFCTYNGQNSSIYLNGDFENSVDITSRRSNDVGMTIGTRYTQNEKYLNGHIDELSIWNRAVSEEEIRNYYNRALSGFEPGLIAHYNFNEAFGDSVFNIIGNSNHGMINGATYTGGVPLQAPIPPSPEILAINVDINNDNVSFSIEADTVGLGYFDFQWILEGDTVMSYQSTSAQGLRPGLHYVRAGLIDQGGNLRGDEVLQSFYILNGYEQYYYTGFEDTVGTGLPDGWNSYSNGQGWYVSDNPFFEVWTSEPGVGNVAISNDDAADNDGENDFNNGSQDFLYLPSLDFTSFGGAVALEFGSFFTGHWNQTAHVTYTTDGGSSWQTLADIERSWKWERQYFDLGFLQGYENVSISFHSNDNNDWGSGFIIDDVSIIENYTLSTSNIAGYVYSSDGNNPLIGASIIAVEENNYFDHQTISDSTGYYSLELISGTNYYLNTSLSDYQDNVQYVSVSDSSLYLNIYLDNFQEVQDAIVEGNVINWYTNERVPNASVLFVYSDDEMQTIELSTDESGYFMAQVPSQKDYDLFVYADGYWVEHDAFYLNENEFQVLSISIAEMSNASRLYGTIRDDETNELIPYAEVYLNCDQASDWDRTGQLGTYRLFNYYPGDCDNGVLVVNAQGYETSLQSVSNIEFEIGASINKNISLSQGNNPEPGMLSGTIISNIDDNQIHGAILKAFSINSGLLYETSTDSGYFSFTLPESEYTVSINADGHQEELESFYVHSGSQLDTVIYLDEIYSNIFYGIVRDNNGNLIDGAIITAHFEVDNISSEISTISNTDGSYQLIVPDGTFDLAVSRTGYQISWIYDVSILESNIEQDFTLDQIGSFDGALMGSVYFFGNLSGTATINIWNDAYFAEAVTAENGTFYIDLINGTYSIFAAANGYTSVVIPDAITIQDNVVNYDIHFSQPGFVEPPVISSLSDVPNDQGRKLDMSWLPGEPQDFENFTQYSIWRKITSLPTGSPELWHYIATEDYVQGSDIYERSVPTLIDANPDTVNQSTFMVTAHTEDPFVFFDSPPFSGFSVDNLFPEVPSNISVSSSMADNSMYEVSLSWSEVVDEDFAFFNVYRSNINSDESAIVFQVVEPTFTDVVSDWGNYEYWVTAVDHNGNESEFSEIAGIQLSVEEELIPDEFALSQNYPNPFNPSTQIRYALAENTKVTVTIYNMLGSKVRTLVNNYQDAGFKNVLWNATNDNGASVSAGMYIYTIQAGNFYQAKKMILLK